jgi:hypothetical protein
MNTKPIGEVKRPLADILNDFTRPIPKEYLRKKPVYSKGKKTGEVDYAHWSGYVRLLLQYCPGYSWQVRTQYLSDRVVVEGQLTLTAAEGSFIYEATGVEFLENNNFGDAVYDAESSAMRRACAKTGLGLYLWQREAELKESVESRATQAPGFDPGDAPSPTQEKVITELQRKRFYAIASKNLTQSEIKDRLKASFGYESTKDILIQDYDKIVEFFQTNQVKYLDKSDTELIKKEAFKNGLLIDDIKKIIKALGYDNSTQVPKNKLLIVLNKIKSTQRNPNPNLVLPKNKLQ